MTLTFYPHEEDLEGSTTESRLEHFMVAAEQYKAAMLETKLPDPSASTTESKASLPRDLVSAYNWDQLAKVLREVREIPEQNTANRLMKTKYLAKLADVYEILCSAKMPKLEAVRLAILSEANQLKGASAG